MNIREIAKQNPKLNIPVTCPICGSDLELNDNMTSLTCGNTGCSSYLIGRLSKWTNKLGIKEWAPTTIKKMIDFGYVDSISSLYSRKFLALKNKDGFGERSVSVLEANLFSVKQLPLSTFIGGYNIASIGEKVAKKVIDAKRIQSFDQLMSLSISDMIVDGIGEITAEKLHRGLRVLEADMRKTMNFVEVVADEAPKVVSEFAKLSNQSFCFTGKLNTMTRPNAEALVAENGGSVSSVKKGLTFLVTNDKDSGSAKNKKAQDLGIQLINEEQFLAMIG